MQFRRLLAAAVGSESRVLRAALVRLCARAGGDRCTLFRNVQMQPINPHIDELLRSTSLPCSYAVLCSEHSIQACCGMHVCAFLG